MYLRFHDRKDTGHSILSNDESKCKNENGFVYDMPNKAKESAILDITKALKENKLQIDYVKL